MRLSLLALALIFAGCNREKPVFRQVTLPDKIEISKAQFATQRFLPTNSGDLAFDTKTGSLCKTWNWGPAYSSQLASFSAQLDKCSFITENEHDAQVLDESHKQEFGKQQWAHEEKMAGKYTPAKPDR